MGCQSRDIRVDSPQRGKDGRSTYLWLPMSPKHGVVNRHGVAFGIFGGSPGGGIGDNDPLTRVKGSGDDVDGEEKVRLPWALHRRLKIGGVVRHYEKVAAWRDR